MMVFGRTLVLCYIGRTRERVKTCPPLTSVVRRSDGFTQYQNTPGINKPPYHIRIPPHKTVRYILQYSEHTQHTRCNTRSQVFDELATHSVVLGEPPPAYTGFSCLYGVSISSNGFHVSSGGHDFRLGNISRTILLRNVFSLIAKGRLCMTHVRTSSSSSDLLTLHKSRISNSKSLCAHEFDEEIDFPCTQALFV